MFDHGAINWGIVAIFVTVYLGMMLGGLPSFKLNRSGVALLGAIAVIAIGAATTEQAAQAIDRPTIVLLFSFMVLSAQMRLGGFYSAVTRQVAALALGRNALLAAILLVAAALSAVFSNDIVCLAMTPVVARLCLQRRLDPVAFLVGLACAANIGSAATLIGNPQNMLIGSLMHLSFGSYSRQALPPVLLSLALLWVWLAWFAPAHTPGAPPKPATAARHQPGLSEAPADPVFNLWQSCKGLSVACALLLSFLLTDWPREVLALVGAGVLLLSRRLHSSDVMAYVDWELLLLFGGLFVVNHAFATTGLAGQAVAALAAQGIELNQTGPLLLFGSALSNLVSNVPAVMLLLPHLHGMHAGVTLALVSTLAGNLLLVGSIANLIVCDLAKKSGVQIDWRAHARIAIPVTLMTLAVVWLWLVWL